MHIQRRTGAQNAEQASTHRYEKQSRLKTAVPEGTPGLFARPRGTAPRP